MVQKAAQATTAKIFHIQFKILKFFFGLILLFVQILWAILFSFFWQKKLNFFKRIFLFFLSKKSKSIREQIMQANNLIIQVEKNLNGCCHHKETNHIPKYNVYFIGLYFKENSIH